MRNLMFWSEVGLSELDAAEARCHRVRHEANPVSFNALDENIRSFAFDVHERFPDTRFGGVRFEAPPGSDLTANHCSREGLVVRSGGGLPNSTVSELYATGCRHGSTMCHPQAGYVLGVDNDLGVDIDD